MELKLNRIARKNGYTIGRLSINGKYFCDTLEDSDRGLSSSMSLDVLKKKKLPHITAIPTGRYQITMDVISPRFSKSKFYQQFGEGRVPRLLNVPAYQGVLIHCFTPDTEVLTENGWQTLEQFKENPANLCMTYNTETGKAEFKPINFIVENDYNGILYKNIGKRINYAVTDQHKIYAGFKKRDSSITWEFREAKDIPINAVHFIAAAVTNGEDLFPHQKTFYRLLMATVADGYILNWSASASQVRFHFTKDRKIERIKELVSELGCEYKIFVDNEGKTNITLDNYLSEMLTEILNPYRLIQKDKILPWDLLALKGEDLKDLVLEYLFWDGRYENFLKNNKNMIISSTNLHNIDVLQAMATLGGIRSYIKDETGDQGRNKCFALVLYNNQEIVTPTPDTYASEEYNGKVWCLNNDNHTLFIRKNYRTMVIGNCGNTAKDTDGCILVGKNTKVGMVLDSKQTYTNLYPLLEAAAKHKENIFITIE